TSRASQRVFATTSNGGLSAISSVDDSSTDLNSARLRDLVTSQIANVNTLYVEEGTPDVVMAAIDRGTTKSTDGGMTWGPIADLTGATYGASKIVNASSDHRVL